MTVSGNKPNSSENPNRIAAIVIIFFSIVATYFSTLDNSFLWDDEYLIQNNYMIKSFKNLPDLFTKKYFQQPVEISYRPVSTLTYFVNYALWGQSPTGYRLFNIMLHFFNALIVLAIVSRLTRKKGLAICAALLFALHPIHTEAINEVSFNEDLMCFLFIGLAFLSYVKYRDAGRAALWFSLSMFFFLIALFTKETAVVFPGIIAAYEYFGNEHKSIKKTFAMPLLFILPLAFFLFIRFGPMKGPTETYIYHGDGRFTTFLYMIQAVARYLNLMFWPARQCVDPPFSPEINWFDSATLSSAFLIFAVFGLLYVVSSKRRQIAFGAAWFILFILPVCNIIPIGVIMAERYLYIPSAGFFIAVFLTLDEFFLSEKRVPSIVYSRILYTFMCVLICTSVVMTARRNMVWETPVSFWEKACECNVTSARSAINLGKSYMEERRLKDASKSLVRAIRLASSGRLEDIRYGSLYHGLTNLGILCSLEGNNERALQFFKQAIVIYDRDPMPYLNMGVTALALHRLDLAESAFRRSLELSPSHVPARLLLAVLLHQTGRLQESLDNIDIALKISPEDSGALNLKSRVLKDLQNVKPK